MQAVLLYHECFFLSFEFFLWSYTCLWISSICILTSTHFLSAKSRPQPWTKSFCIICHTQRHESLEKTGAIISINLIRNRAELMRSRKLEYFSIGFDKWDTYPAQGGRWGSLQRPGFSSTSLVKEFGKSYYFFLYFKPWHWHFVLRVNCFTCELRFRVFSLLSSKWLIFLIPQRVAIFLDHASSQSWCTCNDVENIL